MRVCLLLGRVEGFQEREDRFRETIVLITDHHMPCIRDIRIPCTWDKLQKRFGDLFADQVAHSSSNQVDRTANTPSGIFQSFEAPLVLWWLHVRDETWIPMPSIATVWSEPQVLGEASQVSASFAMRQVVSDDVCCFVD